MKKIGTIIASVAIIAIVIGAISGFKRQRVDLIMPDEIITLDDAKNIVDGYELKSGEVIKTGNKLKLQYSADPLGSGDNIDIELVYYSDEYPRSSVEKLFNYDKETLLVYEDVVDLGEKAFIAFPSIHIYEKGFYVKITAGSGNGTEQYDILKKLAEIAMTNLDKYIEKYDLK